MPTDIVYTNLDLKTNRVRNLSDPALAQDAATKAYVDAGLALVTVAPPQPLVEADTTYGFQLVFDVNGGVIWDV